MRSAAGLYFKMMNCFFLKSNMMNWCIQNDELVYFKMMNLCINVAGRPRYHGTCLLSRQSGAKSALAARGSFSLSRVHRLPVVVIQHFVLTMMNSALIMMNSVFKMMNSVLGNSFRHVPLSPRWNQARPSSMNLG